ncbi:hypothetical protein COU18_00815 [Candidatus Kaiserbacteria bacterium CG10_big_fil_rev_8_21_14_0_10_51_14]|uniref:Bacterial spore germination immunoglobulin-like domain-containing protein n=1 Tax=Candidatus Kaiserbacteria bacterium CG10_big_fil_rev_8_21_14_0_10_51_14 TaxID=1974610 RepID=A0A2H0UC59_9BACT|nr:MAG: hypothetical protein COU18_00815 [Candidatus Kaiserbacteria bacterium CG10_big_fil_rev_8_21_14_0_10_51_14]
MNTRTWWGVIIILTLIVIALGWILFATPAPVAAPTVTPTVNEEPSEEVFDPSRPLHERVSVTSPKSGSSVEKTFTVEGMAPGNWFFEASFPIQVRDPENSKIGQAIAQAGADWMTTELVPFTATITVSNYSGPATLVLLRDNPSGLPENDDALEIPIVVQ